MTMHVKSDSLGIAQSKVTKIGNSTGIVIPKDVMVALGVTKGDSVTFRKTADGVEMVKFDAEYERDMRAARYTMERYHNTLKELAK